jgi:hypothetical protein
MTDREMAELAGRAWVHDSIDMANRQNDIIRRDISRQRADDRRTRDRMARDQHCPICNTSPCTCELGGEAHHDAPQNSMYANAPTAV